MEHTVAVKLAEMAIREGYEAEYYNMEKEAAPKLVEQGLDYARRGAQNVKGQYKDITRTLSQPKNIWGTITKGNLYSKTGKPLHGGAYAEKFKYMKPRIGKSVAAAAAATGLAAAAGYGTYKGVKRTVNKDRTEKVASYSYRDMLMERAGYLW